MHARRPPLCAPNSSPSYLSVLHCHLSVVTAHPWPVDLFTNHACRTVATRPAYMSSGTWRSRSAECYQAISPSERPQAMDADPSPFLAQLNGSVWRYRHVVYGYYRIRVWVPPSAYGQRPAGPRSDGAPSPAVPCHQRRSRDDVRRPEESRSVSGQRGDPSRWPRQRRPRTPIHPVAAITSESPRSPSPPGRRRQRAPAPCEGHMTTPPSDMARRDRPSSAVPAHRRHSRYGERAKCSDVRSGSYPPLPNPCLPLPLAAAAAVQGWLVGGGCRRGRRRPG